jgi:hypothetical protein
MLVINGPGPALHLASGGLAAVVAATSQLPCLVRLWFVYSCTRSERCSLTHIVV